MIDRKTRKAIHKLLMEGQVKGTLETTYKEAYRLYGHETMAEYNAKQEEVRRIRNGRLKAAAATRKALQAEIAKLQRG